MADCGLESRQFLRRLGAAGAARRAGVVCLELAAQNAISPKHLPAVPCGPARSLEGGF